MLGDGKINSLDTHLEQFKLNNNFNQNELQTILNEYGQLLEDYSVLKQAYEDGTNNNGKPDHIEKPRSPYVLVLVDGNGYVFNDELVKDKEEGGMKAARMLNENVEKYLRENIPHTRNCRIIVRIYADLTNLSKQLAKSKLVGLEKRSLAPFAAGFTRAINLFDFTDALDEEGTRYKIRELFKAASEDSACSHILYAACHDTSYLAPLVPLSGVRNKVTLVQGAGFNPEFHQFSLNVTPFPTVFRWSELPLATANAKNSSPSSSNNNSAYKAPNNAREQVQNPSKSRNDPWGISVADSVFGAEDTPTKLSQDSVVVPWRSKPEAPQASSAKAPCKYFQKGFCRYGNKCNFQHGPNGLGVAQSNGATLDRSNVSSHLPVSVVSGFIPLNKDSQRIDTYIKPPTQEEWMIYNARFRRQKPCNSFHLQRVCTTFVCPYDHNELEPEARHALEYVLKCNPCPRKSSCRLSNCFYGHICQKDECHGQMKGCRMKPDLHNIDPKLASMVPAENQPVQEDLLDFSADQGAPVW